MVVDTSPIKPMLCASKEKAFNDTHWLWERKYDGVRAIIEMKNNKPTIYARSGQEKTFMFPDLDIRTTQDCILDGEIVASTGKFSDIQHRSNRKLDIKSAALKYPAKLFVYDVLKIGTLFVIDASQASRKELLSPILIPTSTVDIAPIYTDGVELYTQAESSGWEGIIGKDRNALYEPGKRHNNWIKVKVPQTGTFWVMGYTEGIGKRIGLIGNLILATRDPESLEFTYVGDVGTGFDDEEMAFLRSKMDSSKLSKSDIMDELIHENWMDKADVHWAEPFEVNIRFLEWTDDKKLRFPAYKGRTGKAVVTFHA